MNLTSMWMMLWREVKTKKNYEFWFVVNGTPIRFSLTECALIFGLRIDVLLINFIINFLELVHVP